MLYLCNFQYTRFTCIPDIYINDLSYNFKWNPRLFVDDTFLGFFIVKKLEETAHNLNNDHEK